MANFINQPIIAILSAISLSIVMFKIGVIVQRKLKTPAANPMLFASAIIILILLLTGVPYQTYSYGSQALSFLLGPATVALAVPLCKQIQILARNWQAVLVGVVMGTLMGVCSSFGLALALKASPEIILSLVPKSVTTPIAMEISQQIGGIPSLTASFVIITGVIGAMFGPELLNLLKIRNEIARGLAIGAASHALGTTRAIKESQLQGAISGVSIGLVGLTTAILTPYLLKILS
jgi:predicted murein hydrolase (TIGR00659 family)